MNDAKEVVPVTLVVSAGRTDLQVLVKNGRNECFRAELDGSRELHQQLIDGEIPYRFEHDCRKYPKTDKKLLKVSWDSRQQNMVSRSHKPDTAQDHYQVVKESRGDNRQVVIVPAKIASIVDNLKREGNYQVRSVVVLGTRREDPGLGNIYHREPVAAAPLLARYLAEQFGLDVATSVGDWRVGKAVWFDFLVGSMRSPGKGRNFPLNREGVQRIDGLFKWIAEGSKRIAEGSQEIDGNHHTCLLSLAGGLPDFKEPIRASAEYRFQGSLKVLHEPEYEESPEKRQVRWETNHIAVSRSLYTRRQVEELLLKGDFVGANALALPFSLDPKEKRWAEKVAYLHDYFANRPSRQQSQSPQQPEALQLLKTSDALATVTAMQCEAALRREDYDQAVQLSVHLFEIALMDHIRSCLPGSSISILLGTIRAVDKNDQETLSRWINQMKEVKEVAEKSGDAHIKPAIERSPNSKPEYHYYPEYRYSIGGGKKNLRQWFTTLAPEHIKKFDEYQHALIDSQKIDAGFVSYSTPKKMRNAMTHNGLGSENRELVIQVFEQAALWGKDEKGGYHFLSQPLLKGVLSVVEGAKYQDPLQRYDAVIKETLEVMRNYRIE